MFFALGIKVSTRLAQMAISIMRDNFCPFFFIISLILSNIIQLCDVQYANVRKINGIQGEFSIFYKIKGGFTRLWRYESSPFGNHGCCLFSFCFVLVEKSMILFCQPHKLCYFCTEYAVNWDVYGCAGWRAPSPVTAGWF